MRFVFLCALLVAATSARAQYPAADTLVLDIAEPATDEEANHAPEPNAVPYETETTLGEHILAFPSTLWSGVTYPFRELVLWAEYSGTIERLQQRFLGPEPPAYGFSPTFGVGGRDGLTLGGTFFHNDVFGTGRQARIGGRYGFQAPSTYAVFGRFRDPALFGGPVSFGLDAAFESDGDERIFALGNDSDEDTRVQYGLREFRGGAAFVVPVFGPFSLNLSSEFRHVEVDDFDPSELATVESDDVPIVGTGEADLLSAGGDIIFDFSRAGGLYADRTFAGPVFILGYRYGQDVNGRDLAYNRVRAEARQFIPLPGLASDRRLALRLRYEKTHPPEGDFVPFYELATLGDPDGLRGFANDRFRDEGSVLFTAEYRYPVADALDAVLFYDAGQVFRRYRDIDPAEFNHDAGFGFRLYGRDGVAGRLELAFSREGARLLARVGTTF